MLSHSPQLLWIAQADAAAIHFDESLIAPFLEDSVHRFTREANEFTQVALTESQRNQHALPIADARLLREFEQRVRQPRRGALAKQFHHPRSECAEPKANELRHVQAERRRVVDHLDQEATRHFAQQRVISGFCSMINLANDIATGRRSVDDARKFYAESIMAMMKQNKKNDYLHGFRFTVTPGDQGDRDKSFGPVGTTGGQR